MPTITTEVSNPPGAPNVLELYQGQAAQLKKCLSGESRPDQRLVAEVDTFTDLVNTTERAGDKGALLGVLNVYADTRKHCAALALLKDPTGSRQLDLFFGLLGVLEGARSETQPTRTSKSKFSAVLPLLEREIAVLMAFLPRTKTLVSARDMDSHAHSAGITIHWTTWNRWQRPAPKKTDTLPLLPKKELRTALFRDTLKELLIRWGIPKKEIEEQLREARLAS